jgi:hypothetical protein
MFGKNNYNQLGLKVENSGTINTSNYNIFNNFNINHVNFIKFIIGSDHNFIFIKGFKKYLFFLISIS